MSGDAATGTASAVERLDGGGEMGARMRAYDWAETTLGSVDTWSQNLKTAVSIAINSRYPMFVWWGPHLINFYNHAYIPMLGARQETYFTWSYSPVADDDGVVNGVFCAVTAETVRKAILRKQRAAIISIEAGEAQRRQLSRELHDGPGQKLTALVLKLQALKDGVCEQPSLQNELQRLQAMAGEVSNDMHRIALELRPGALDDRGLQTALTNYIEDWSRRYRIAADFQPVGLGRERLPTHVETTIYRIVQEALTNVIKHARATTASVVVQREANDIVAVIEDNGCGFDVLSHGTGRDGRLGLVGMKERAALLSGTCHVESQAGNTCVFARIPLADDRSHG